MKRQNPIKVTNQGEHYFEIPDEYIAELDWQAGDSAIWIQNEDGSFYWLKKKVSHSNGYSYIKM